MTHFDTDHAHAFLRLVFAGQPGLVNICWVNSAKVLIPGEFFATDDAGLRAAAEFAERIDRQYRPPGIYWRVSTLAVRPKQGRGLAGDSLAVPIMWTDTDFGEIGHKHDPAKHNGLILPPTEADAHAVNIGAGLGEPTITIHSGGGLYGIWRLDRPVPAEDAELLATWTQAALVRSSLERGFAYGSGVGDLSRVLRLPGSVNRKAGLERPCRIIGGSGQAISPDSIPEPPAPPQGQPAAPGATRPDAHEYTGEVSVGPSATIDRLCSWSDILSPADWTFVTTESSGAELWLRPGSPESMFSVRCWAHNLVAFSEACGIPTGRDWRHTKARTYAYLHYDGDLSAAIRALVYGENVGGLPQHVVDELTGATVYGMRPAYAPPAAPEPAQIAAVTDEDIDDFIATFTRHTRPRALFNRTTWMRQSGAPGLMRHAVALAQEAVRGWYPAENAVHTIVTGCRLFNADADTITKTALAAILNEKAAT